MSYAIIWLIIVIEKSIGFNMEYKASALMDRQSNCFGPSQWFGDETRFQWFGGLKEMVIFTSKAEAE